MPNITRKTDKTPIAGEPLCPLTRRECLGDTCLWWDEAYHACTMCPVSVYNQLRDAVTDAMVDVMRAYKKEVPAWMALKNRS